jgi:hypothetical protein
MEGYNLNERMARYEPESALCEFCGVTENTNLEDYCEVMLYKETDRMKAVIVSSTSYSMVQVLIPCCSPCRVKRNDVKMKSATIGGLTRCFGRNCCRFSPLSFHRWCGHCTFIFVYNRNKCV